MGQQVSPSLTPLDQKPQVCGSIYIKTTIKTSASYHVATCEFFNNFNNSVGLVTTAVCRALLQKHNWCVLTEGGADTKRSRSRTHRHPVEFRLDPGFHWMYFGFQKLFWNAAQPLAQLLNTLIILFLWEARIIIDSEVLIFAQP